MIPIIESRGSIPYGILILGLPWYNVVFVSIIANFFITIPIIYLLKPISKYFSRFYIFEKFFNWLFSRSERKGGIINKLKILGLIVFIGIPLPVTGAWTGCVAAHVVGLNKFQSLIFKHFQASPPALRGTSVHFRPLPCTVVRFCGLPSTREGLP